MERNLNFEEVINRRGTGSLKYDCAVQRGKPADVLPLWVADMDFRTSSYVQDAVLEAAVHGIWGYSEPSGDYFPALATWMERRHGWKLEENWVVRTPGVVFALALAVRALTAPGDAVLIQQPVYYPFREVIEDNGRRMVSSDLVYDREAGRYGIDFEDLERVIRREKVRLFLLCSPHNPVGRVWTREELLRIGRICRENGVFVASDEIHGDFVFSGKHIPFTEAGEGFGAFSLVCTAPTKTFNLAGLQISNIVIPDAGIRKKFRKELNAAGYSQANLFGLKACAAAYAHGEEWLEALLDYLRGNLDYLEKYIHDHLPGVRMIRPEGTFLVWLDLGDLGFTPAEQEQRIVGEAGLWLDSGRIFGKSGTGFERINIACPRSILEKAVKRLSFALV